MATIKSEKYLHNENELLKLVGFSVEDNKIVYHNNDNEFIVLDTETSGLNAKKDRVVQFSAIKYKSYNGELNEVDRIDLFINQPVYDENAVITGKNGDPDTTFGELTGITNDMLSVAPTEEEVFPVIKKFLGDDPIFICYNTPFDYEMLVNMYSRQNDVLVVDPKKKLDVLVMAKDLVSKEDAPILLNSKGEPVTDKKGTPKKTWKLEYITKLYGLEKTDSNDDLVFHSSINDVVATGRLLNIFIKEYAERKLKESSKPVYPRKRAKLKAIKFWLGYRGFSRFYIDALLDGKFVSYYFDVRKREWGEKTEGCLERTLIDELKQDVYDLVNVADETEFANFKMKDPIVPDDEYLKRYE